MGEGWGTHVCGDKISAEGRCLECGEYPLGRLMIDTDSGSELRGIDTGARAPWTPPELREHAPGAGAGLVELLAAQGIDVRGALRALVSELLGDTGQDAAPPAQAPPGAAIVQFDEYLALRDRVGLLEQAVAGAGERVMELEAWRRELGRQDAAPAGQAPPGDAIGEGDGGTVAEGESGAQELQAPPAEGS